MVGSNSSVMAPRAFSSSPWRVMSKTSVSVGSESLRMSHHSTYRRDAAGQGLILLGCGAGQLLCVCVPGPLPAPCPLPARQWMPRSTRCPFWTATRSRRTQGPGGWPPRWTPPQAAPLSWCPSKLRKKRNHQNLHQLPCLAPQNHTSAPPVWDPTAAITHRGARSEGRHDLHFLQMPRWAAATY